MIWWSTALRLSMSCLSRSCWHWSTKNLPCSFLRSSVANGYSQTALTVLEPLLKTAVHLAQPLRLPLVLQLGESLRHLLAHLLRSLQVLHEFDLVLALFSVQESLQPAGT